MSDPIFPTPAPERHLLIGLGNPGREYRFNRHNIGFMLLDLLVDRYELLGFTRRQGKALITTGDIVGVPVVLAKPQTYMNLSGEAAAGVARFYNIPRDRILVCLDDIDLPLGTVRLRAGGGSAGQRGLQSVIDHIGSIKVPRLRIGIGRPPGQRSAAGHVLRDLQNDELEIIQSALNRAGDAIETFLRHGVVLAMSRHNGPAVIGSPSEDSAG